MAGNIRHVERASFAMAEDAACARTTQIQLRVLAEDFHQLMGIDFEGVTQPAHFVGEGDLQRVIAVVDIFHRLGDSKIDGDELRVDPAI